jgi:hypothetical protein
MRKKKQQEVSYVVGGINLTGIRNRNEVRVSEALRVVLREHGHPELSAEAIQKTYAYALNRLPSRYAQFGTIILGDPVRPHEIYAAVKDALQHVLGPIKPS